MNLLLDNQVELTMAVATEGIVPPHYPTEFAGGLILHAAMDCMLREGLSSRIPVGFGLALPLGMGALITSYLPEADFRGVIAAHGILGADDREPIDVVVTYQAPSMNKPSRHLVRHGDPIAQLSFFPLLRVKLRQVSSLATAPGLRKPPTFTEQQ